MTGKQIDDCIKYMDEICDKRALSRALDVAFGIIRHFEDSWPDLPIAAKKAFVIQYGEENFKKNEKQNGR